LADEKGLICAEFLVRAAYFADHGDHAVQRVMTDNAWTYKHSIKGVCDSIGARQKFIKQYCPWQNGGRTPQRHPGHRMGLPPGLHDR
jgi:hypothetical protein